MNDQLDLLQEGAHIEYQNTEIIIEDHKTKHPPKIKKKNTDTKSDPPSTFDELEVNLNEDINEPTPETMLVNNAVSTNINLMKKNQRVVDGGIMELMHLYQYNVNDMKVKPDPIVEYAEEPLLPLTEACAPLIKIIPDLSIYVKIAIDETPSEPPNGLTIDESAAIRLYTVEWIGPNRSLYSMLNYTLKNASREQLRPYYRYMKLFLTALVKLPCIPPLTVWRGVTKNLSEEFPPGTSVTWWAFSSCTTALTVLENNMYLGNTGNRTLFSVEAINARTVRNHSHFVTEDEILLLPGTRMIVQSQFSPASELHIIHLKQIIPDEVLLEPPFEGH